MFEKSQNRRSMNHLMGFGVYLLLGLMYVCLSWKTIERIGRGMVGDRLMLAIPFILPFWPVLATLAVSDHISIMGNVSEANRAKPLCECGARVRITAEHMRGVRDDGSSQVTCAECGEITALRAQTKS